MGPARGSDHGKGRRQFVEQRGIEIERTCLEAKPRADGEKGRLVESLLRQHGHAAHVGFTDRPADLLGDVEQRPHQRIDRTR